MALSNWGHGRVLEMVNKRSATRVENELANMLWERGFAVVRGPSSGSATKKRFQPDLLAVKDGRILVIEVKQGRESRPLYIPPGQVKGLLELEKRSGGLAVVAVKISWIGWRFHILKDLPETKSGRRKISKPESGMRLYELENLLFSRVKVMDEYFG